MPVPSRYNRRTATTDDPLDAVLRPPPDETPEQRQIRLAREESARKVSAAIDAEIKAERQARKKKRIVRLLLLGQSESGKSFRLLTDVPVVHDLTRRECRQIDDTTP